MNENNIENILNSSHNITKESINSDYINREDTIGFKIFFISMSIVCTIFGIFMLINKKYYFSDEYNFKYINHLFIFVIIYSIGLLTAVIISFVLSIFIYIILKIINCCSKKKKNNDINLGNNINEISFINLCVSISTLIIIFLYLSTLIYGVFLIIKMRKNINYKDFLKFFFLYCFIIINILLGFSLFIIFLKKLFNKQKSSNRVKHYKLEEEYIENIEKEINDAFDNK
jgi:hypothetical protein